MNYNNQCEHIIVKLSSLNLSLFFYLCYRTHVIVQNIHWLTNFTKIIE